MLIRHAFFIFMFAFLSSCETAYYNTMEKVGYHKRDILVSRVESARESQAEGQEQFKSALEQFRSVVNFDGGSLEREYNKLNATYEDSVTAADEISERVDAVENVAEALFKEWEQELDQYSSANLRRSSQQQLSDTRRSYSTLISKMRRAEKSIQPVLAILKDNTLFLKHNLNARAVGQLKGELRNVDRNVQSLIANMESAIQESDKFIKGLK